MTRTATAGTPVAGQTTPSSATTTMTLTATTAAPASSSLAGPAPSQQQPCCGSGDGSASDDEANAAAGAEPERLVLRLHRTEARLRRLEKQRQNDLRVEWDESVVDNEHLNRKKSKSTFITLLFLLHHLTKQDVSS